MRKNNGYYTLPNYFRSEIALDTALDARHMVSVLSSMFVDLKLEFSDKCVVCHNLRNHMLQKICITWKKEI